jgi:hypothetical protein
MLLADWDLVPINVGIDPLTELRLAAASMHA